MTQIAIVIPAAGASARMRGRDKLLEVVDGEPLLKRIAGIACKLSDVVIVTLPELTCPRADVLSDLNVSPIGVPDASDGMSVSLRTAARVLPKGINGLMILPADMPDLTLDHLRLMAREFARTGHKDITQATGADGTPGHPVIFPADLIAEFAALSGDEGARSIIRRNQDRLHRVRLPDRHALTDLDTPEDWADWRAENPDR